MIAAALDSFLTRASARKNKVDHAACLPTKIINTATGPIRVYDSGGDKPCVVFVPDGPNVIEHYETLLPMLSQQLRVVCFDMPGFGHSLPQANYRHTLNQGAQAVINVLDQLGIAKTTLAFSCANGFYALRVAQLAPARITNLVLSQTPALAAMRPWGKRCVPLPLRIPVFGQLFGWALRSKIAQVWYSVALPKNTPRKPFADKAQTALTNGGCFCLASVCQNLSRENVNALSGVTTPCTLVWGAKDHSHKHTDPLSMQQMVPHAQIVHFEDCGHFPDLEQPERYAQLLMENIARHT
jgi:pimeloyl-ACP methyl ester carboxylesterase